MKALGAFTGAYFIYTLGINGGRGRSGLREARRHIFGIRRRFRLSLLRAGAR